MREGSHWQISDYNGRVRVAVNLLPFRSRLAGAGRYSQHILRELFQLDRANEYVLFVALQAEEHFQYDAPNVTRMVVSLPDSAAARIAYEQTVLPLQLALREIDVLFTASVAIPVIATPKTVTVIYDMIAEHSSEFPNDMPEGASSKTSRGGRINSSLQGDAGRINSSLRVRKYPPLRNAYVRWMSRYAAVVSDAVITISENSCREIVRYGKVSPEKIHVARPGVAPELRRISEAAVLRRVRERYRLPERFVLYLGTLEPGKNLPRLVRAYTQLRRHYTELPHHLVLAGAHGWGVSEIEKEIQRSSAAAGMHLIGFVDERDLPALYSLADLFVYPSLYEGFGMPPLEAMACGTPVIVSNVSALPEVVGSQWAGPIQSAGVLVPPTDTAALTNAMARVLTDDDVRARLRAGGLERAKLFRWDDSARVVQGVLTQLL